MARVYYNGREVDANTRKLYGARKLLDHRKEFESLKIQIWNRERSQDRRWLGAQVRLPDRGGITRQAERQLLNLLTAPSKEAQKPKFIEGLRRLSDSTTRAWERVEPERAFAKERAGLKLVVWDWWEEPGKKGFKKRRAKAEGADSWYVRNYRKMRIEMYEDEGEEARDSDDVKENKEIKTERATRSMRMRAKETKKERGLTRRIRM